MKYLCLAHIEENRLDALPDKDLAAYEPAIRTSGHCTASGALQSVQIATTVRVNATARSPSPTARSPRPGTALAGFYLIEAHDLNEAIQIAAKIPPAHAGSIEVRLIHPIRKMVAQASAQPQTNPSRGVSNGAQ